MTGNELPLEVAPLGEHQIDVAAVILAPVDTDPPHVYAIADAVERARKLPASFGPFVRYTTMFGDPLTTATALPEAIALRRGAETPEEGFKAGLHQTPSILGRDAFARLMPVLSRAARFHQKCSPGRHLRTMLTRTDAEPLLRNLEARNVPLYQSHGFMIAVEEVEPNSGIRACGFLRE